MTIKHVSAVALATIASTFGLSLAGTAAESSNTVPTLETSLKEGTYTAFDSQRFGSGTTLYFRYYSKHERVAGDAKPPRVIGIAANMGGSVCYDGMFSGNTIKTKEVVNLDRGASVGEYTATPLREGQLTDYSVLVPSLPLRPFPDRRGFGVPEIVYNKTMAKLSACSAHFGVTSIPSPCGDPDLRFTDQSHKLNAPKYFHSEVLCYVKDSANCTASNVFALLLATPSAVAPTDDLVGPQEVLDCGILKLEPHEPHPRGNSIRILIDTERFAVYNYTRPGHQFFPGSVVRYVVELDGRVDINTEGWGTEGPLSEWINVKLAPPIWKGANRRLRASFVTRYGRK